jgi:hypothetical protein
VTVEGGQLRRGQKRGERGTRKGNGGNILCIVNIFANVTMKPIVLYN